MAAPVRLPRGGREQPGGAGMGKGCGIFLIGQMHEKPPYQAGHMLGRVDPLALGQTLLRRLSIRYRYYEMRQAY